MEEHIQNYSPTVMFRGTPSICFVTTSIKLKGTDRLSRVVKLSMQCCGQ